MSKPSLPRQIATPGTCLGAALTQKNSPTTLNDEAAFQKTVDITSFSST